MIDSHAHLTDDALFNDIDPILERYFSAGGTKIINICTDSVTLERGISLAQKYPQVVNAGSIPPHDVATLGEKEYPIFEKAAKEGLLVAIGETGLDYHYRSEEKALQKLHLKKYQALAEALSLPLIIHCREAFADLFLFLNAVKVPVIIHCFTGTEEEALEAVRRGWYLSFSGIITFKNAQYLRDIAAIVPLSSILIETDAPYLAPGKYRGKRCEPAYVIETAQCVSEIKNIPLETCITEIDKNIAQILTP